MELTGEGGVNRAVVVGLTGWWDAILTIFHEKINFNRI